MECRIEDFHYKEVVNVCDGQRLGYVSDLLFDIATGQVTALIVPGPCRMLGLFWHEDDYILPWECIRRIGGDIVLVEVPGAYRRGKRARRPWFTWQFEDGRSGTAQLKNGPETPKLARNIMTNWLYWNCRFSRQGGDFSLAGLPNSTARGEFACI